MTTRLPTISCRLCRVLGISLLLWIAVITDGVLADCLDKELHIPVGPYLDQLCSTDQKGCIEQRSIRFHTRFDSLSLLVDSSDGWGNSLTQVEVRHPCDWNKGGFSLYMGHRSSALGWYFDRYDRVLAVNTPRKGGILLLDDELFLRRIDNPDDQARQKIPDGLKWLTDIKHNYGMSCMEAVYYPDTDTLETQCETMAHFYRGASVQGYVHRLLPRVSLYKDLLKEWIFLKNSNGQITASDKDVNEAYQKRVKEICAAGGYETRNIGGQQLCHNWGVDISAVEGCDLEQFAYDKPLDLLAIQCRGHKAPYFMRGFVHCFMLGTRLEITNPFKYADSGRYKTGYSYYSGVPQTTRLTCVASAVVTDHRKSEL